MAQERLWVYRNTLSASYPVVLVFGREANNEGPMNDIVGQYSFELSPSSAFWNRSYGAIARCAGLGSAAALKRQCDLRDGSPIAFANSSPVALPYGLVDKSPARSAAATEVASHVKRVFELADQHLGKRLKLAVLGVGSDFLLYTPVVDAIQSECRRHRLPLADVGHFGGRVPNERLDSTIGPRHRELIREIVGSFLG